MYKYILVVMLAICYPSYLLSSPQVSNIRVPKMVQLEVAASDFIRDDSLVLVDFPAKTMITDITVVVDTLYTGAVDSIKIGMQGDDPLRLGRFFNDAASDMTAGYSKRLETRNYRTISAGGLTTYDREVTVTCTDADTYYQVRGLDKIIEAVLMDTTEDQSSLRIRPYHDGLHLPRLSVSFYSNKAADVQMELFHNEEVIRTVSMSRTISATGRIGVMASFGPQHFAANDTISLWAKSTAANTVLTIDHMSLVITKEIPSEYYYTTVTKKLMMYTNGLATDGRLTILIDFIVLP